MGKRAQRRQNAVLPLKVLINFAGNNHLAHTLDISASGARIVLGERISPGTSVSIEFRRRRTVGTTIWCKPLRGSKYNYEIGVRLKNAGSAFWGIDLPLNEPDSPEQVAAIGFPEFLSSIPNQR